MTLYSDQRSGNCYKVRLLLTQLGVPFRVEEIDVVAGGQRTDQHLARNRNGKVPVVEMDDGACIPESGAILFYFAQNTPLWPVDQMTQTRVLQWMFFEQYSHEPNLAVARFWCHYLKAEKKYEKQLVGRRERGYQALGVMEHHLREQPFFVARRYTIADIALYAYTHVAHEGGFDLEPFPAIRAWLKRVVDQPRHITIDHHC